MEENQGSSRQRRREILCETTATRKVKANHLYIPAGLFILFLFLSYSLFQHYLIMLIMANAVLFLLSVDVYNPDQSRLHIVNQIGHFGYRHMLIQKISECPPGYTYQTEGKSHF